jgi:hypothetical protein
MPSIKDSVATNLSGYSLVPAKPPIMATVPTNSGPATNLRCPLPPFNSDPDTLRQFENNATGPKNRVWPQPQQTGSTTVATKSVARILPVSPSSSSSGSSGVAGALTTATATTNLLISGTPFQGSINLSKSFLLVNGGVNAPCEIRLYGTAGAQAIDAYRATGDPVPPEISMDIITCVTFDTAPYVWDWQDRCGSNQSSPQTSAAYISVFNTVPSSQTPVTVSIQYVPVEV